MPENFCERDYFETCTCDSEKIIAAWRVAEARQRLGTARREVVPKRARRCSITSRDCSGQPQAARSCFVSSHGNQSAAVFYAIRSPSFRKESVLFGEEITVASRSAAAILRTRARPGDCQAHSAVGRAWAEILCQVLALKATNEVKQSVAALLCLLLSASSHFPACREARRTSPTAPYKRSTTHRRPGSGLSVASELDQAARRVGADQ